MEYPKLYVVVRDDLKPGQQAVQLGHALVGFLINHPILGFSWFRNSNHLAYLSVPNETGLVKLIDEANRRDIRHSIFKEPDMNDSITAVAFEPGDVSRVLCEGLPLALRNVSSPIDLDRELDSYQSITAKVRTA